MNLLIQPSQPVPDLKERLQKGGWQVLENQGGDLLASDNLVTNQQDARFRLNQIGLLTSSQLRIEFLSK